MWKPLWIFLSICAAAIPLTNAQLGFVNYGNTFEQKPFVISGIEDFGNRGYGAGLYQSAAAPPTVPWQSLASNSNGGSSIENSRVPTVRIIRAPESEQVQAATQQAPAEPPSQEKQPNVPFNLPPGWRIVPISEAELSGLAQSGRVNFINQFQQRPAEETNQVQGQSLEEIKATIAKQNGNGGPWKITQVTTVNARGARPQILKQEPPQVENEGPAGEAVPALRGLPWQISQFLKENTPKLQLQDEPQQQEAVQQSVQPSAQALRQEAPVQQNRESWQPNEDQIAEILKQVGVKNPTLVSPGDNRPRPTPIQPTGGGWRVITIPAHSIKGNGPFTIPAGREFPVNDLREGNGIQQPPQHFGPPPQHNNNGPGPWQQRGPHAQEEEPQHGPGPWQQRGPPQPEEEPERPRFIPRANVRVIYLPGPTGDRSSHHHHQQQQNQHHQNERHQNEHHQNHHHQNEHHQNNHQQEEQRPPQNDFFNNDGPPRHGRSFQYQSGPWQTTPNEHQRNWQNRSPNNGPVPVRPNHSEERPHFDNSQENNFPTGGHPNDPWKALPSRIEGGPSWAPRPNGAAKTIPPGKNTVIPIVINLQHTGRQQHFRNGLQEGAFKVGTSYSTGPSSNDLQGPPKFIPRSHSKNPAWFASSAAS